MIHKLITDRRDERRLHAEQIRHLEAELYAAEETGALEMAR